MFAPAVLLVTAFILVVVVVAGVLKEFICTVFPLFRYVVWCALVVGWVLFVRTVFAYGAPCEEPVERFLQFIVVTGVYVIALVAARLVLVPVYMVAGVLKVANEKPEKW